MAEFIDDESDLDRLPGDGDPYRAFGSPVRDPVSVKFLLRDGLGVNFPYARLGFSEFHPAGAGQSTGDVMILRFDASMMGLGSRPPVPNYPPPYIVLTLEGRTLHLLWEQLMNHRTRWVWEIPEGHRAEDSDATVVASIRIDRVTGHPG